MFDKSDKTKTQQYYRRKIQLNYLILRKIKKIKSKIDIGYKRK